MSVSFLFQIHRFDTSLSSSFGVFAMFPRVSREWDLAALYGYVVTVGLDGIRAHR